MKDNTTECICRMELRKYVISGRRPTNLSTLKRLFLVVLFVFLTPIFCMAEDIYIAQNAAGSDVGYSCSNAHSALWFNTTTNWGSGAGKISAGDTVHLCGTITSQLTIQGNGSPGLPITIYFEPGANITPATYCDHNGCLKVSNRSYIIVDGGTDCGYINGADVPCNGTIRNTTAIPSSSSFGIVADSCSNCEFKNLNIGPLCEPNGVDYPGGDNRGIQNLMGTPNGSTWKVHNNVIHGTSSGIVYVPQENDNGLQVYNNYEYENNSHVDISNNNNGTMIGAVIHHNHFGSTAVWDYPGCPAHHNSLHAFAKTGSNGGTNSGIDYYNNFIDGDWGNCATSGLFIEGGEYGANRNVRVFNNVFQPTYDQMNNGIVSLNGDGALAFNNNTIIGIGANGDLCFSTSGDGTNTSIRVNNNIIAGCRTLVLIKNISLSTWDYNIYGSYDGGTIVTDQSIPEWYSTIAQWQSVCNCDAHSLSDVGTMWVKVDSTGHLQNGSPAIDIGVDLSSLGITALNSGLDGVNRPKGSAWDIGAYEYYPPPQNFSFLP